MIWLHWLGHWNISCHWSCDHPGFCLKTNHVWADLISPTVLQDLCSPLVIFLFFDSFMFQKISKAATLFRYFTFQWGHVITHSSRQEWHQRSHRLDHIIWQIWDVILISIWSNQGALFSASFPCQMIWFILHSKTHQKVLDWIGFTSRYGVSLPAGT